MLNNTSPIFTQKANLQFCIVKEANTEYTGTGTAVKLFKAGINGSSIDKIRIQPLGTNVATVLRFFINNGKDRNIAENNSLFYEIAISATTASEAAKLTEYEIILDMILEANFEIYATSSVALASGHALTCIAGDF